MEKKCTKCGEVKSLDEFSKNSRSSSGVKASCKACDKARYDRRWLTSQQDYHVKRYNRVKSSRSLTRKICTKCGEKKSVDDFTKRPRNNSGLSSHCKTCSNQYGKEYKQARYGRQTTPATTNWREKNRDKVAEMQKRADAKRYHNPERVSQRLTGNAVRRSLKRSAPSESWSRREVYEAANSRCLYCGIKVPYRDMHADHFTPLSKGGSNLRENIVCSCASCNLRKSDKMPEDFIGETL